MPATLTAAACAAFLMNAQPVLPTFHLHAAPSPALCEMSGRVNCAAAFLVLVGGGTAIVALYDDFSLLVHEGCHLIQHAAGRALDESECEIVQARAWLCPAEML